SFDLFSGLRERGRIEDDRVILRRRPAQIVEDVRFDESNIRDVVGFGVRRRGRQSLFRRIDRLDGRTGAREMEGEAAGTSKAIKRPAARPPSGGRVVLALVQE